MTDSSATPDASPDGAEQPTASWVPEPAGNLDSSDYGSAGSEHPELAVGAAFAGGLLAALILKRLAR